MTEAVARRLLLCVLFAGVSLRAVFLESRSFWFDEAFSFRMANDFSVADMVQRTAADVHPPLYYVLLGIWMRLAGTGVVAIRAFSLVMAGASVIGVYLVCRDALDSLGNWSEEGLAREVSLLAAALVASGATYIQLSWEARMYSLGAALTVFSSWAFVRGVSGNSKWYWALYVVLATGLLYTHNYGIFSVAAHLLFLVTWRLLPTFRHTVSGTRQGTWLRGAVAMAAVVCLYLPWLPIVLRQSAQVKADYWISPVRLSSIPDAWAELLIPSNADWTWLGHAGTVCTIAIASLAVVIATIRVGGGAGWFVAALIVLPILLSVAYSVLFVPIFFRRYLLFSLIFFWVGIAMLVGRIGDRYERWATAVFLVAIQVFIFRQLSNEFCVERRLGVRGAVEYVLRQSQPGEPVVVLHPCVYFSVEYYCRGRTAARLLLARMDDVRPHEGRSALRPGDLIQSSELENTKANRIWVIDTTGFSGFRRSGRIPEAWVRSGPTRKFTEVYSFLGEVLVDSFVRKGPEARNP